MAYKNHIISRLQKINKWFSRLSGYQCLKIIIEYKNIGIHLAEFKLALLLYTTTKSTDNNSIMDNIISRNFLDY